MSTLLVALSHPDDEIGCAGTIAAHVASGHRVVLLWLSRGEMTEAFGDLPDDEVADRRMAHGAEAADILGCEHRFMTFPDTRIEAGPDAAREVAAVVAEVRPDAVVTWGGAWRRGMRHPDHQAAGRIVRDAVTLARIGKVVRPLDPHRADVALFTLRGEHSTLPEAAVDVTEQRDTIMALQRHYYDASGQPTASFLEDRLRRAGARHGVELAELFDAWETPPGLGRSLI